MVGDPVCQSALFLVAETELNCWIFAELQSSFINTHLLSCFRKPRPPPRHGRANGKSIEGCGKK